MINKACKLKFAHLLSTCICRMEHHDAKNIYDLSCDQYYFTRSADPYLTAKIFDLLQPNSSGMHLDIGCGTGNYTMLLATKGLNFTGIALRKNA